MGTPASASEPKHVATAFEPFRQVGQLADPAGGRDRAGTAAVQGSLVEMHGGSLKLVSGEGKGTTVTVTLPNPIAELACSADDGAAASQQGPERVLAWLDHAPGN